MIHCHLPHHMMNQMMSEVGSVLVPHHPLGSDLQHAGHTHGAPVAADAQSVRGYPQDMWMVMDDLVKKPETTGLRPTWTAGMMGMMTLVRVLEPEMFDRIAALKADAAKGGRP
jgi:hypothetical protein